MKKVDILLLDAASASAAGTTAEILAAANRIADTPLFDFRFLSPADTVDLRHGQTMATTPLSEAIASEIIIIPGLGMAEPKEIDSQLKREDMSEAAIWLRHASEHSELIATSCTGAFLLALSGLLAGRRCVTTWWLGTELAELEPTCEVSMNEMVVHDGKIMTAGSSFAHIDLMLALLRLFAGIAITDEVARRMILDSRTSQAGYLIPSHLTMHDDQIAKLEAHVRKNLKQQHTLRTMASFCRMGERTLMRRTQKATGLTPGQLMQKIRLERSIHLLKTTRLPINTIANEVGLSDATALHRLVKKQTGNSPGFFRSAIQNDDLNDPL